MSLTASYNHPVSKNVSKDIEGIIKNIHVDLEKMKEEYGSSMLAYYSSLLSPLERLYSREPVEIDDIDAKRAIFHEVVLCPLVYVTVTSMSDTEVQVLIEDKNIHPMHSERFIISRKVQGMPTSTQPTLFTTNIRSPFPQYYKNEDIEPLLNLATQSLAKLYVDRQHDDDLSSLPETMKRAVLYLRNRVEG